jgi:hypothetical protein
MAYKIVFLHLCRNCAENQAFNSIRIGAERLGHILFPCGSSMGLAARGSPGESPGCRRERRRQS